MNKRKFDSLPAEYRTILIQSARETATYQRDLNAKQVAEILAGLKEAGMEVIQGHSVLVMRIRARAGGRS